MSFPNQPNYGAFPQQPPPRKKSYAIWWVLGGAVIVMFMVCAGFAAMFVAKAPNTAVYRGTEVPENFLKVAREVGALEHGEQILYFYSDALLSIREGFYFVSDRKVVVYSDDFGESPLIAVPFAEIFDVQIERNLSFFEDSMITLYLEGGDTVFFPVSSEYNRDQDFFVEIQNRSQSRDRW